MHPRSWSFFWSASASSLVRFSFTTWGTDSTNFLAWWWGRECMSEWEEGGEGDR